MRITRSWNKSERNRQSISQFRRGMSLYYFNPGVLGFQYPVCLVEFMEEI
jgi:hypothetical protein